MTTRSDHMTSETVVRQPRLYLFPILIKHYRFIASFRREPHPTIESTRHARTYRISAPFPILAETLDEEAARAKRLNEVSSFAGCWDRSPWACRPVLAEKEPPARFPGARTQKGEHFLK